MEESIRKIFPKGTRSIAVNLQSLKKFKDALDQQIVFPAKLRPVSLFSWEEYYLSELCEDNREYKKLKKIRPTSDDLYSMSRIDDFIDIDYGLLGRLTRLSDKKRFKMPLLEFESVDKHTEVYKLLDCYKYWFVNYK